MQPQGWDVDARRMETCPERSPPWMFRTLRLWWDRKRFGGLPEPGGPGEQCSKTLDAFEVLDAEFAVIELAHKDEQIKAMEARARG